MVALFLYLLHAGRRGELHEQRGWGWILAGFGLLVIGSLVDISDHFPQLNRFIILGQTPAQAVVEKLVGSLLGFIFLLIGFWLWIPHITRAKQARALLKNYNAELESAVADRTVSLRETVTELVDEVKEHEQTQVRLRTSERRFQLLARSTSEGIAVLDGITIVEANAALRAMFAYSEDQILGREIFDLLVPEEQHHLQSAVAANQETLRTSTAITSQGDRFATEFHLRSIEFRGKKLTGVNFLNLSARGKRPGPPEGLETKGAG